MVFNIFGGGVTLTVTYEALDAAAAETLAKTAAAQRAADELRSQCDRMRAIWEGDAADCMSKEIREILEKVETRLQGFRQHASNLQLICRNYSQASSSIAGTIQTLSSDVIV